jgi:hypothetical protein
MFHLSIIVVQRQRAPSEGPVRGAEGSGAALCWQFPFLLLIMERPVPNPSREKQTVATSVRGSRESDGRKPHAARVKIAAPNPTNPTSPPHSVARARKTNNPVALCILFFIQSSSFLICQHALSLKTTVPRFDGSCDGPHIVSIKPSVCAWREGKLIRGTPLDLRPDGPVNPVSRASAPSMPPPPVFPARGVSSSTEATPPHRTTSTGNPRRRESVQATAWSGAVNCLSRARLS